MYKTDRLLFKSGGRSNYRIPSIVAAPDGTIFAFCNDRKDSLSDHAEEIALVCAVKKKNSENFGEIKTLAGIPDWECMIGSAVCDTETGEVFCSFTRNPVAKNEFGKYTPEQLAEMEAEADRRAEKLGISRGDFLVSTFDGENWREREFVIKKRPFVRPTDGAEIMIGGSCHGSSHGIRLRHGKHAGRLLCPSRVAVARYDTWEGLQTCSYNNSVYSDDHGVTWNASAPVQAGTGEGTLIELGDGSILYNSRAYYRDMARYLATSTDGGETYGDFRKDEFLCEERSLGCNASFLRIERDELSPSDRAMLPNDATSVTLFANPRSEKREKMTVCVSFDDGATWAVTRMIWEDACAYSSLDYSSANGTFCLLYERGGNSNPYEHGIAVCEFDLEWLMGDK